MANMSLVAALLAPPQKEALEVPKANVRIHRMDGRAAQEEPTGENAKIALQAVEEARILTVIGQGHITVASIVKQTGFCDSTIRRNLKSLEAQRKVVRRAGIGSAAHRFELVGG